MKAPSKSHWNTIKTEFLMGWHQKEMNKIFTEVLSSCSLRAAIKGPSPAFRQRVRGCHAEKKTEVEPEGIFTKHVETTNFCESSFLLFQWCAYWIYLKHRDFLLSALKPNRSQVSTMVRIPWQKNGLFVCVTSIWRVKPKPKAAWWFQPLWKISVNGKDYPIYYGKKTCSKPPTRKCLSLPIARP